MPLKFSLLVPSYNRPEYIEETVNSLIINQGAEFEIIVADDASPKQAQIHSKLLKLIQTGKIQWIGHAKNLGWSENRNSLVKAASGDYIVLLGDDDRLKPNAITSLCEEIKKNPGVGVFGIGYDIIDERGDRVFSFCPPRQIRYSLNSGNAWKELFYYDALPMWTHHPFTLCCRRDLALRFPYNPAADIGDDVLFLFEVVASGETVLATGLNLFDWRNAFTPQGPYSNLSSNTSRSTRARRLIWTKLIQQEDLDPKIKRVIRGHRFYKRFLEIGTVEINILETLLKENKKSAVEFIVSQSEIRLPKRIEKFARHIRATLHLGPKHVLCVYRNAIRRFRSSRKKL